MRFFQLFLVLILITPGALAKGNRWFTLVNQSGYNIDYMYVRPVDSEDWSDDILGQDHLSPGESVSVTWSGKHVPKVFDVHIQYEDGEKADLSGLSYPAGRSQLVIYWDQKTLARWE